jgi:hypothetical protein
VAGEQEEPLLRAAGERRVEELPQDGHGAERPQALSANTALPTSGAPPARRSARREPAALQFTPSSVGLSAAQTRAARPLRCLNSALAVEFAQAVRRSGQIPAESTESAKGRRAAAGRMAGERAAGARRGGRARAAPRSRALSAELMPQQGSRPGPGFVHDRTAAVGERGRRQGGAARRAAPPHRAAAAAMRL